LICICSFVVAERIKLGSFVEPVMEFVAVAGILHIPVHRIEPLPLVLLGRETEAERFREQATELADPDLAGFP